VYVFGGVPLEQPAVRVTLAGADVGAVERQRDEQPAIRPQQLAQRESSVKEVGLGQVHQHRAAHDAIEGLPEWQPDVRQAAWCQTLAQLGVVPDRLFAKRVARLDAVGVESERQKPR